MASEHNDHPVGAIHEDHHHLVEVSTAAKHLVSKQNTVQSTSSLPSKSYSCSKIFIYVNSQTRHSLVVVMWDFCTEFLDFVLILDMKLGFLSCHVINSCVAPRKLKSGADLCFHTILPFYGWELRSVLLHCICFVMHYIAIRLWQNNCWVPVTYGSETWVGRSGKYFILDKNFNIARYWFIG